MRSLRHFGWLRSVRPSLSAADRKLIAEARRLVPRVEKHAGARGEKGVRAQTLTFDLPFYASALEAGTDPAARSRLKMRIDAAKKLFRGIV